MSRRLNPERERNIASPPVSFHQHLTFTFSSLVSFLLTRLSLPSGLHTNTDILFHVIQQLLSSSVSPVLSSLLRIVQQNSDDVEEAAEHFEGKVKHSHSQTCNAKKRQSKTQTITVEKKKKNILLITQV